MLIENNLFAARCILLRQTWFALSLRFRSFRRLECRAVCFQWLSWYSWIIRKGIQAIHDFSKWPNITVTSHERHVSQSTANSIVCLKACLS